MVLAGRRINDGMGQWLVEQLVLEMARKGMVIAGAKVLVLGLTFKANCPDLRNTRVIDVIMTLQRYGIEPLVVDPWVDAEEAKKKFGLDVFNEVPSESTLSAVIAAVAHDQFRGWPAEIWRDLVPNNGILFDLKGLIPRELGAKRL